MNNTQNLCLVMVIYDSVTNSVFQSQVVEYLHQLSTNRNVYNKVYIVSFETKSVLSTPLENTFGNITMRYYKRYRFIHWLCLVPGAYKLKTFLSSLNSDYHIIARGAYAAYSVLLALHFSNALRSKLKKLTIQVRGLLQQEYLYSLQPKNIITSMFHQLRADSLAHLEKKVFCASWTVLFNTLTFEAVSPALAQYITSLYNLAPSSVTVADCAPALLISTKQKDQWRSSVRKNLDIAVDAYVYCYNGSAKAWQCPEKVIDFFAHHALSNPTSYLMILSADGNYFTQYIRNYYPILTNVIIMHVAHQDIYRYLASCDEGIILRKHHIVNWTSRPTKLLEYQAAGLKIMHNNTIAMLISE